MSASSRKGWPAVLRAGDGDGPAAGSLRDLVGRPEILVAPGVFDCITARLVAAAGFAAAYVTGSGVSLSLLGAPDVGYVAPTELFERVRRIADIIELPLIVDADTGFGGPLNVVRCVRELERAGARAIQLEDQAWPKKCGHEAGRRLVPVGEMLDRIAAALDARRDDTTLVVARTDARSDFGIEAAIERAAAYRAAGADILFVESPESREEMARINAAIAAPTLANMVEGGRTPLVEAGELGRLGYDVVIYPNALTRVFAHAGREMLRHLRATGGTAEFQDRMLSHGQLWDLFEYRRWLSVETSHSAGTDANGEGPK